MDTGNDMDTENDFENNLRILINILYDFLDLIISK